MKRVVIVGGGTAGWMAAAALSKSFGKTLSIELIESDEIGTVGVGEATIPPIRNLHLLLELGEAEFLHAVNGTYKLGIEFENWGDVGEKYFHPFSAHGVDTWAAQFHHFWVKARQKGESAPLDEFSLEANMARSNKFGQTGERKAAYAYHFDAGLYAQLLRRIAEDGGMQRTEGKVVDVSLHPESGFIESVTLESGKTIAGDLFIDCSGFRGLLIEQALQTGWEDWGHWLRNDRAIAVQTESVVPPAPYTRAIARSCGWQWKIPLQNRVGNGLVYSSRHMSEDDAQKTLLDNLEGKLINEPRTIRFRTGRRLKQWNKNCVALGLASGFLEPLESTSIHLIQRSIIRLMQMFPYDGIRQPDVDEFNNQMSYEIEHVRDFIVLHYHVTERNDTPFWRQCRTMDIPESLTHRIELFRQTGRVFKIPTELFGENSWIQVMLGQGLLPEQYHPIVNMMDDKELEQFLTGIHSSVQELVKQLPGHQRFIDHYCKAVRP